jgi:hypothetical protein
MSIEEARSYFSEETLKSECKFKIKDYIKSAKLFFNTESKKTMVDQTVDISNVEFQSVCKRSDQLENTVYIKFDNRSLRFSLDDIEILYPNIKGLSPKKDRTVKVGSEMRLIRNKELNNINIDTIVKVKGIKTIGHKTCIGFDHNNKHILDRIKNFKLVKQ